MSEKPEGAQKRILIAGGGFGGIRTALNLSKMELPNTIITLVSDKHHFEYTPTLYKIATGMSPMETCIPLAEIFNHTKVEVLIDTINGGNLKENFLTGISGARYRYDFLVLGLGSEPAYFNIPGIKENSFSMKTVGAALKLKRHIHELFDTHNGLDKGRLMSQFQFVIIGGGPSGVELSGVIRHYVHKLAEYHGVPKPLVTIDLIQAAPRLLPTFPEEVSDMALKRLNGLGVNIILGKSVVSEDASGIFMKDITLNAKTIIWTAGVRPSTVYQNISGLSLEKSGKILVDEFMHAADFSSIFVLGDSASTKNSGTAQTAIYDGEYIADAIRRIIYGNKLRHYKPRKTPYVVPIGNDWAIFNYKDISMGGRVFWWLRELIDFRFLLSILPFRKAYTYWKEGRILCESCPTCLEITRY